MGILKSPLRGLYTMRFGFYVIQMVTSMESSINYVVKNLGIVDPPPPSWPLLLMTYVIKWSFG